LSNSS
jgi:hypothetical protein